MSNFLNLLDHKCDIYHLKKEEKAGKYGLPSSKKFSYCETPNLEDIPCHFNVKNMGSESMRQLEPQNTLAHRTSLVLPIGTDIRTNDKVVDKATGLEYTAEVPRNIRGHHIKVMVFRTVVQEAL